METLDFVAVKQGQIAQYRQKAKYFQSRVTRFTLLILLGVLLLTIGLGLFALANPIPGAIYTGLVIGGMVCIVRVRRTSQKSRHLLNQFADVLERTLGRTELSHKQLKAETLRIESNFLNNDDELFTKKFVWQPYLEYLVDTGDYYARGKIGIQPHPRMYVHDVPPMWMEESPFQTLDARAEEDFVFLNWRIKRRIRDLYFAGYYRKAEILSEITDMTADNPAVFERFLRHKKISKGLKVFKRAAWIRYLTPAAKMQLVTFVDGVLNERPYVKQCDSMIDLLASKNVQIDRYTQAFWKVHRRSLKFYVAEVLMMLLLIPVLIGAVFTGLAFGFLAGAGLFVVGGAVVVYTEMALVTRQKRDLKAKKLTPNLISSLIAIRHNMCAESVNDDEVTYQYERAFKNAEKRFILTVTEAEAVKLAKENISDKVKARLTPEMTRLRVNKESQAHIYYEKFNHYRLKCIKYGALELGVMLLALPLLAVLTYAALYTGPFFAGEVMMHTWMWAGVGLAVALELIMLRNHIRVARRKELYLLIYQKMAVLLSDYQLFTNPKYIAAELAKLENSVVRAAEIDNMQDIAEHVSSVAVVDLGADADQLSETYKDFQNKLEVGTHSVEENHFQGSVATLERDFELIGTSTRD